MTGGWIRPAHGDLDVEALVATTSTAKRTRRLTVEQRAIAALCHDLRPRRGRRAAPPRLGVTRVLVGDMADETWL
jgi:hypothetical protein